MKNSYILFIILFLLSCTASVEQTIDRLKVNDRKLLPPEPGDWLYDHPEKGQTFRQYKTIKPVTVSASQNVIYLQPIGSFTADENEIIKKTAVYLETFFNLKTKVLPVQSDEIIPDTARREDIDWEQLYAPYILNKVLVKNMPEDAIVVMAVTSKDLYPHPQWNYVFGLASYKRRVGVSSLFRYMRTNKQKALERFIKTASHEVGHMFSMAHCTNAVCLMNGVNSLVEADPIPNRLCSECMNKLSWNLKLDNKARFMALMGYFQQNQMLSDYKVTAKDLCLLENNCK